MGRKTTSTTKKKKAEKKKRQKQFEDQKEVSDLVDKLLQMATTPAPPNVQSGLEEQREISKVSAEVIMCQSDYEEEESEEPETQNEMLQVFRAWLILNGGLYKGVSVEKYPDYNLGLKADEDIAQGTLIVAIPRKLMITVEAAKQTILGPLIERDHILKNMPNVTLAIFLLYEKFKEASFWKPYIEALPKEYNTVLYFDVKDLEELQGSPTLESALKQIKSITRQYAYFHRLFNNSDDQLSQLMRRKFTIKEYRWAVSTVMTRQNTIPASFMYNDNDGDDDDDATGAINQKEMVNALIPFWDLCNHANGPISTDYNDVEDRSECLAMRNFKAGEQVFICYGPRSNADFFIHNGFVYEDNIHDSYELQIGLAKADPLREKKSELLKKCLQSSNWPYLLTGKDEGINRSLLAFLRLFNMNEAQLDFWLEDQNDAEQLMCYDLEYDENLERKAWCFLRDRIKLLLGTYKTSLQEDLELLKSEELSVNKRLAIRMRVTEKKIFQNTLDIINNRLK